MSKYTTKEKILMVLFYLSAIIIALLMVFVYSWYSKSHIDYQQMIDYRLSTNNFKINNIQQDETLATDVYLTNQNPEVLMVVRFKLLIDEQILDGADVNEILKVKNSELSPLIYEDGYYYVKATKAKKFLLFNEIEWLVSRRTNQGMTFAIKVEAINANKNAIQQKWIDKGQLSVSNARKLNYIK